MEAILAHFSKFHFLVRLDSLLGQLLHLIIKSVIEKLLLLIVSTSSALSEGGNKLFEPHLKGSNFQYGIVCVFLCEVGIILAISGL